MAIDTNSYRIITRAMIERMAQNDISENVRQITCLMAVANVDRLCDEVERLRLIIAKIDATLPKADHTCDEPGITYSEAVRRQFRIPAVPGE